MSELLGRIRKDILLARKGGDQKTVKLLSLVVGEVDTVKYSAGFNGDVTDETVVKIIKKIINSNNETISRVADDCAADGGIAVLQAEIALFEAYLPDEWSKDQIREEVLKLTLPQGNVGATIGFVVKHFKGVDGIQDGKLISEVVRELCDVAPTG